MCAHTRIDDATAATAATDATDATDAMSTPVESVTQAPTFGGLSGYKRKTVGNPTSMSRATTPFRGVRGVPGSDVVAPRIRNSYNRQDRGSNQTIPQSRLVPWDALKRMGRVSPGDVVFTARMKAGGPNYASTAAPVHIAGVDWMNRQLGKANSNGRAVSDQWCPGVTVLLGADIVGPYDEVSDNIADEWRTLPILRSWAVDGVVMSNDEPGVYSGSGSHDAQIFNIAVQGIATVNNGYGAPQLPCPPCPPCA